ncbi:hypothetical protein PSI22_08950 [Xenorhabdus sp. XENO-7]|uniref:Uncharacterized protein n=1 Tax=Xenorhabdus aichiensis TaxID=3025874 RepID=A0ABT5M493_9GAMM|nr:hypothetical protein [Xenorhabdus aichiensis]MDC9621763.1 hypothetical protein [Xenorhabdus aichiensis]
MHCDRSCCLTFLRVYCWMIEVIIRVGYTFSIADYVGSESKVLMGCCGTKRPEHSLAKSFP